MILTDTDMRIVLDAFEPAARDWLVQVVPGRRMSRKEYRTFVTANPDLRIERTALGEVIVMPPVHGRTGYQNGELSGQLRDWARKDAAGLAFDSSSGFDLPCGSNRSPDAAWGSKTRLAALPPEERNEYLPLCPDFVAELRSESDRLSTLCEKMREYIENGARLAWLVDPVEKHVYVYRPGVAVEILDQPRSLSGEPELPGFALDLHSIWNPEF